MKIINFVLLIILLIFSFTSCRKDVGTEIQAGNPQEVTLSISASGNRGQTRAPVPDPGHSNESIINELDLLVFGRDGSDWKYLYRREAFKLSTGYNEYRVMLLETSNDLKVHLLANCRTFLRQWEESGNRLDMKWEDIHNDLVDVQPWTLTNSNNFQPLPMWGESGSFTLSTSHAPTKLPTIELLRSVASIDLYVEENARTSDFILTDIYAYYAPDRGYVGAREVTPTTTPVTYMIPAGMTTSLTNVSGKQLHALKVEDYLRSGKNYKGIAYQLYLYDNKYISRNGNDSRPTRVIMAGYYKQSGPESGWTKSYYPIDIVHGDGSYRPVIRNWKYEFNVTGVNGPGSGSLEEAAEAAGTDLNIDIIFWNKEDIEIGVKGHYYVNMERKKASLWRPAGSVDKLGLTYRILDDDPADFTINFRNDSNGTQTNFNLADGIGIANDYFKIEMIQTHNQATNSGAVSFTVTALQNYTAGHSTETVLVRFRDLLFEITITQVDKSDNDWDLGGSEEIDLGQ